MPKSIDFDLIREAARSQERVGGWTHDFYRYPARFSPAFAEAAIREFSKPGNTVLDPFVGGGTTAVEALVHGRNVVAADINSLAVFVTRAKTTPLSSSEVGAVSDWASEVAPKLHLRQPRHLVSDIIDDARTHNLTLARARSIKKAIAIGLINLDALPTENSRNLARCLLLKTSQWALDNRKRRTPLCDYRARFVENAQSMTEAIRAYSEHVAPDGDLQTSCRIFEAKATDLTTFDASRALGNEVDLVVASPPYPGIHMLYHRWQIDGRRETPAPYWIADCQDGQGTSYYTFGDRRRDNLDHYFSTLRESLLSIRQTMKRGAHFVQMVSFSERQKHLRRYLSAMNAAGFEETIDPGGRRRIWRDVPNRKWHATFKGQTTASREVVLIHRAV